MIKVSLILALLLMGTWHQVFAKNNEHSLNYEMMQKHWVWSPIASLANDSKSAKLKNINKQESLLVLKKKGTAYLVLPKGHWLRFNAFKNKILNSGFIWQSTGNGLFLPSEPILQKLKTSSNQQSNAWLLKGHDTLKTLVRIDNPFEESLKINLSIAKEIIPNKNKAISFKQLENLDTEHDDWYYLSSQSKHMELNRYDDNEVVSIELQGPGSWKLESRLLYEDQTWQRFIDTPLTLNGKYWNNWRMHPSIDHANTLHKDRCNVLTSYPESYHFSLPEGQHRLEFSAPQAMFLRVLNSDEAPYLFSRNQPNVDDHLHVIRDLPLSKTPFDETYGNQLEFDKAILNAFYSGSITQKDIEAYLGSKQLKDKASYSWVHGSKALNEIIQRYQFWKPLNITNHKHAQHKAWLVPTKLINPKRSTSRYIRKNNNTEIRLDSLVTIEANRHIELHAPTKNDAYSVRLQLPIYSKPYDMEILDRNGQKKNWLWRPKYFSLDEFEILSGQNLTDLYSGDRQYTDQALATVSGYMTLKATDFPIRLSHNAKHNVSLSAFYKEERHFSLDKNSWQRAIKTLGKNRILELLTRDSINKGSLLENKVIQDLRPIKEWLFHSRQAWSEKISKEEFSSSLLRKESISSLTKRLESKGEYKLLTDILKGISIKDPSPKRRSQAMNWLSEYYTNRNDAFNISAYHSWKFKYFPQLHLPILTRWLVQQGQSNLALRLYSLFPSDHKDLAKHYTYVKHNWLDTDPSDTSLHLLWQSIWEQDWNKAQQHSNKIKSSNDWQAFMEAMPSNSDQNEPVKWLAWLNSSPDSKVNVPVSLKPKEQAGTSLLYHEKKDRSFQLVNALPSQPVKYEVTGPVNVQFSFRLQHPNADRTMRLDDWIEIKNNNQKKWFPIFNSRISENLSVLPKHIGSAGSIKHLNVDLGPGRHTLHINALNNTLMVSAKVYSPALLSELMDSIQNGDSATAYLNANQSSLLFEKNQPLPATELLDNLNINQLKACNENSLFQFFNFSSYNSKSNWKTPDQGREWKAYHSLNQKNLNQQDLVNNGQSIDAINNPESLEQYLLSTLWNWPNISLDERADIVAKVNKLAKDSQYQLEIRTLINKLNQSYSWKKENLILSSAGSKRINNYIESSYITERETLIFQGKAIKGERLYGHNQLGLMTDFRTPTKLNLTITQTQLPYHLKPKANLIFTLNQKVIKTATLSSDRQTVNLSIPKGKQRLRIRLQEPSSDHWIYVQASAVISGKRVNLMEPRQSKFHVATQDQPLILHIKQASWLRIDQYKDGKIKQVYQLQNAPGKITLKPRAAESASMYRVFSLQTKDNTKALLPFSVNTISFKDDSPLSEVGLLTKVPTSQPSFSDDHHYFNPASTNGFYYQYDTRYDLDDDTRISDTETFNEFGWRHRQKLHCLSCYWRSDVFARSHTDGETDVIGAEVRLQGELPYSDNWVWRMRQEALYTNNASQAWRWAGSANLINTQKINQIVQQRHNLELFAQHLSFDVNALPQDTDVYSPYKNDHRWGLKLEESLSVRPWLDTVFNGHFRVVSNELDQTLDPDYLQAELSWLQYWKPLEISLAYRHRTYLIDDQRDSNSHQPTLGLNLRVWHSFNNKDLVQYRARFNQDVNNNDYTFTFEISWNMTSGMGFNHFMPSESAFHSLKREAFNPLMKFEPLSQEALHGK